MDNTAKTNKKPEKESIVFYDYFSCRDYLQEKYGFQEQDYSAKFTPGGNPDAPYQDFWHFVVSITSLENGDFITMSDEWKDAWDMEDWQLEILEYYLSEFGEDGGDGIRFVRFMASW